MPKSLESRLNDLIHEITKIKKQIILEKSIKVEAVQSTILEWKALGKKVSANWDGLSAVEEIRRQREKVRFDCSNTNLLHIPTTCLDYFKKFYIIGLIY